VRAPLQLRIKCNLRARIHDGAIMPSSCGQRK
jgi:hypothetical protein